MPSSMAFASSYRITAMTFRATFRALSGFCSSQLPSDSCSPSCVDTYHSARDARAARAFLYLPRMRIWLKIIGINPVRLLPCYYIYIGNPLVRYLARLNFLHAPIPSLRIYSGCKSVGGEEINAYVLGTNKHSKSSRGNVLQLPIA